MNPKKWEKVRAKLLLFFILGILGISISFLFSSCGTGPLTKALVFNAGSFALDFNKVPDPWPADASVVISRTDGLRYTAIKDHTSGATVKVGTDGNDYVCILSHTSSSSNRPITGGSWATYWSATGTTGQGSTWQSGKSYNPGSNQPSTGSNWQAYWVQQGSGGSTWQPGRLYYTGDVGGVGLGKGTKRLNELTESGFTIEGWVKSATTTPASTFQGGILSRAHDNYGCVLYVSGDPKFSMKPRATTTGGVYTVSSGVVQYNSTGWTHVAGVYANEDHSAVHDVCTLRNVGGANSIAIDSNDNVHISYYHGGSIKDLKYATNASGSWEITRLSTLGGGNSSIAIDSNNDVHISYYDNTSSAAFDLRYATCASGSNCTQNSSPPSGWSDTLVRGFGKTGNPSSIAIDSNNKLHVAFYLAELANCNGAVQTTNDLRYATCDAANDDCAVQANWTMMTIEDGTTSVNVGNYPSITVDSSNNLHISYYRGTGANLKYATCTPAVGNGYCTTGGWSTSTVVDSTGDVGRWTSIATDSSGNAYISYQRFFDYAWPTPDEGYLKYATNASGAWVSSIVDNSVAMIGQYTSIAIDSVAAGENVHISYYDSTNGNLKYATCDPASGNGYCTSGGWTLGDVDTAGDVGRGTSIAVDSSDNLHISYRDETNQDLKYATNATGSWVTSTVDDGDARGETPHIDIYINGEFQACAPVISIGSPLETRPTCTGGTVVMASESNEQIGRSQIAWTSGIDAGTRLEGIIDDVRFWRVGRTQSQIQQCMSGPLAVGVGDCTVSSNLGGYWMLNEGSGTSVYDASGAGSGGSISYCEYFDGNGDGDITDNPGDVNCAGPTANSILWGGGWTSDTPF